MGNRKTLNTKGNRQRSPTVRSSFHLLLAALTLLFTGSIAHSQSPEDDERPPICPPCPECECAEEEETEDWDLSLAVGFNLTEGNSNTTLLNGLASASREWDDHILSFDLQAADGSNEDQETEENGTTTQRYLRGNADYKYLYSKRAYIGANLAMIFDEVADVDYRYIPSLTAGYFLIKDKEVKFNVEAGPSYVFEKVGGEKRDYAAPRVAERFEWKITKTSKIFEEVEVLFSLDDGDDTLVTAEAGVEAAISSYLSLVFSVRDIYDNVPAEGRERNDLIIISALKFAL